MKLCWEEAFIRCRVTGDFTTLANYLLVNARQFSIMTGQDPTDEMKSKAQGYLRRCGQWRVTATSLVDSVKPNYPWHTTTYGLRTEYELSWEPTSNPHDLGLVNSTIEGTGRVEIDKMKASFDPPGTPCPVELEPGAVKYEPHAKLSEVTFDQPKQEWVEGAKQLPFVGELKVGGYFREVGPPTLRSLTLALYVPLVASRYKPHCTISIHETGVATYEFSFVDLYEWFYEGSKGATRLKAAKIRPGDRDFVEWRADSGPSPFGLRFSKGWKVCGQGPPYRPCASPPFAAHQSLIDTGVQAAVGTFAIELEVEIEHEPR
jgi:hypothetical protein